jgi:hypothetical protein
LTGNRGEPLTNLTENRERDRERDRQTDREGEGRRKSDSLTFLAR